MPALFDNFWLVHVDRQAVATWGGEPVDEVGEHFWLVRGAVAPHPFVRFAMPVALALPLDADLPRDLEPFARASGATRAAILGIRRHGRHAAARAVSWARGVFGSAALGPALDPTAFRALTLQVLVGDKHIFVCSRSPEACFSPFPGGLFAGADPQGPSRAGGKLAEARLFLAATRGPGVRGGHWLELGAYPGGMTAALAGGGARVTAVDLRPRPAALAAFPGVTWHQQDVEAFTLTAALDGLVCDLNGPHLPAARTVARLARTLRAGAPVIHTLKLSRWADLAPALAETAALFSAASLRIDHVRHFCANRQEVAVLAARTVGGGVTDQ